MVYVTATIYLAKTGQSKKLFNPACGSCGQWTTEVKQSIHKSIRLW